jgi:hypothetical protein
MTEKIAEYFPIWALCYGGSINLTWANINYIRARILRESKLNEYTIIDRKVGDDHRSYAENPMAHALSGQWCCGSSKLDVKQSSLRRVKWSNLTIVSWRAELVGIQSFTYRDDFNLAKAQL